MSRWSCRVEVAEQDGVVLQRRAIQNDLTPTFDQRVQHRRVGLIGRAPGLGKVLPRPGQVHDRLLLQHLAFAHGRQDIPRRL